MSLPGIDTELFLFLNRDLRNGLTDWLMPLVTKHGRYLFLPFVLWIVLRDRRTSWIPIVGGLFAVALADGAGSILKDLFARPRPCQVLQDINLLVGCRDSWSMPSSHASNAFAFAAALWPFLKRARLAIPLFLIAALIAYSRIAVGVHYPSDVAAGAVLGLGAAGVVHLLLRWGRSVYEKGSFEEALFLVLLLFSLFRVWFILKGPFDLSFDEAHYWEWSRRPDWSYYSKGPVIAYLILAGTTLFGDTVFGVRFFAIVLSVLTSFVIFRLGRELFDSRTGFAAAVMVQIVPLYAVYGVLMTIDAPFIACWVVSLYLFHKAVTEEDPKQYWIALGLASGVGLLTKYTMAFFFLSAFIFLLADREARRLLFTPWPYITSALSFLIFSPVILWNAARGWVTVKHTAGQAHVADGLVLAPGRFFEFVGSQFGVITPLIFIMMFLALWKLRKTRQGRFLASFSVPVIAFFLLKSLQGKVQANWALTGYAAGFIAFSSYFLSEEQMKKKAIRYIVAASLALPVMLTSVAHFPQVLNLPTGKDPTLRLAGWKDLGKAADREYEALAKSGPAFIFSDSYQVSSELAFYMKERPVTYCVNFGRRMNQYDLWPGFEGFIGRNALFVQKHDRPLPEKVAKAFVSCERSVAEVNAKKGKPMQFTLGKCYDFRGMELEPVEKF